MTNHYILLKTKDGERKIPLSDLLAKAGLKGESSDVFLCVETRSGVIRAGVFANEEYSTLCTDFMLAGDPNTQPIPLANIEQQASEGSPVRTFLHDRECNAFASWDQDIRPDCEADNELLSPELTIYGSQELETIAKCGRFVRIENA